jgi:hypothetical protein
MNKDSYEYDNVQEWRVAIALALKVKAEAEVADREAVAGVMTHHPHLCGECMGWGTCMGWGEQEREKCLHCLGRALDPLDIHKELEDPDGWFLPDEAESRLREADRASEEVARATSFAYELEWGLRSAIENSAREYARALRHQEKVIFGVGVTPQEEAEAGAVVKYARARALAMGVKGED